MIIKLRRSAIKDLKKIDRKTRERIPVRNS